MKQPSPLVSISSSPPMVDLAAAPFIPREYVLKQWHTAHETAPSVAESDVSDDEVSLDCRTTVTALSSDNSSEGKTRSSSPAAPLRERLQWEFEGLTLWLEYDEPEGDLSKAIDDAVHLYGIERIPIPHSTAIYGMQHLTVQQAREKLHILVDTIMPTWPSELDPARGITQGIAENGKPGQVCSIAWAEVSFSTNEAHELALDRLYSHFEMPTSRAGPWTPHISFAYDNPEQTVLNMPETVDYVVQHPTLLQGRRIKALSLWDTNGKMGDWKCMDRVWFS